MKWQRGDEVMYRPDPSCPYERDLRILDPRIYDYSRGKVLYPDYGEGDYARIVVKFSTLSRGRSMAWVCFQKQLVGLHGPW